MNRILPSLLAACAALLLSAAVAAEQQLAPPSADAAGTTAVPAAPVTGTETPARPRDLPRESEPEWPQPRCEAPAE